MGKTLQRKAAPKSWVWNHYTKRGSSGICSHCPAETAIKCEGGSTSALRKHLSTVHQIGAGAPAHQAPRALQNVAGGPLFAQEKDRDRSTVISRLAAQDNIPFSTMAASRTLGPMIEVYTEERMPRSPNTIKSIVMKTAAEARNTMRDHLDRYQKDGGSFAIAFDEATATHSPHRYISLTVRSESSDFENFVAGTDFFLGLIRVTGRVTADIIATEIRARLNSFNVRLDRCHFAVTDGASVMRSAASKLDLSSQLCFVHGLHNALARILDDSKDLDSSQKSQEDARRARDDYDLVNDDGWLSDESDSQTSVAASIESTLLIDEPEEEPEPLIHGSGGGEDTDEEESQQDSDTIEMASIDSEIDDEETQCSVSALDPMSESEEISLSVGGTIEKIRTILKSIKRSGIKRDKLRHYTAMPDNNNRSLQVVLDVKVRWYSTITMLERAAKIMPSINKILEEFDEDPISRKTRSDLDDILRVLVPVKHAMLLLCESQATLFHADRIIDHLLAHLRLTPSPLSTAIQGAIVGEFKKRRTSLSSLFQYLNDPDYDWEIEKLLGEGSVSDDALIRLMLDLVRQDSTQASHGSEEVLDHEQSHEPQSPRSTGSFQKALTFDAIFAKPARPQRTRSQSEATYDKIQQEMKLHVAGQSRGRYLNLCLRKLTTIQPTSVKPERDFSVMNHICSKTRNSLGPNTLDSLMVLRSVYRAVDAQRDAAAELAEVQRR